jgi:hypothetical protein
MLPFPPFKAITRFGHIVEIKKTDALFTIAGVAFPLVGYFQDPDEVSRNHCSDSHVPVRWQANGKFDMPNNHAHPLDLVSIVATDETAIGPLPGGFQVPQPFPNPQQAVTQPAAPSVPESQPKEEIHTMAKTINSISVAALTPVQAAIINNARQANPDKKGQGADERKQIKREVFSVVKAKHGIPETQVVRASTHDSQNPEYLVLHTGKKNGAGAGLAYRLGADGRWDGTYVTKDQLFPPPAVEPSEPAPASVEEPAKEDQVHYVNEGVGTEFGGQDANPAQEVGQSAGTFLGVATAPALPDGIRLVSVSDRTVVIEVDSDIWNHDQVGADEDRHIFTAR